jgi:hypothetical protein
VLDLLRRYDGTRDARIDALAGLSPRGAKLFLQLGVQLVIEVQPHYVEYTVEDEPQDSAVGAVADPELISLAVAELLIEASRSPRRASGRKGGAAPAALPGTPDRALQGA